MSRPNDCIICGQRAGSREHLFPAALGGRRVNKGIYCGLHNEGFSPLAKVISDQLAAINALLSVRPDHSDEPRSFEFEGPRGESYVLSGDGIGLAEPQVLSEVTVGASRQMRVRFSDDHQAQQWLAAQRAAGFDVQLVEREERTEYFPHPLRVRLTFGGPEGLKAIGYIALTFLAHYFPTQARQGGVLGFKQLVQGANENEFVWWDTHDAMKEFPANPYEFGHTIAIGVSASRGGAFARVCLFSTLIFAVHFGAVCVPFDQTTIVHIDPQAELPRDISEVRQVGLVFEVNRPSSLTAHLQEMITGGRAQESFQRLLARISELNLRRIMQPVYEELEAIRGLDERERNARIEVLVDRQGQRVLNLMRHVVSGLKQRFEADPGTAELARLLDALVAGEPTSLTGLSQPTVCALEIAKARLAKEIERQLSRGELDLGRLSMLFGGGPGAALVGEAILEPIIQRL